MTTDGAKPPHNYCKDCNTEFESSFDLIDHLLEEGEEFDPYLVLPNGMKLMVGSLLRFIYANADDIEQIDLITQSTYVTLFAAENGYDPIEELVEDMVVQSAMFDFDASLKELLETKGQDDKDEGR